MKNLIQALEKLNTTKSMLGTKKINFTCFNRPNRKKFTLRRSYSLISRKKKRS